MKIIRVYASPFLGGYLPMPRSRRYARACDPRLTILHSGSHHGSYNDRVVEQWPILVRGENIVPRCDYGNASRALYLCIGIRRGIRESRSRGPITRNGPRWRKRNARAVFPSSSFLLLSFPLVRSKILLASRTRASHDAPEDRATAIRPSNDDYLAGSVSCGTREEEHADL